jgi:tRNA G37 N-methylase Trm5
MMNAKFDMILMPHPSEADRFLPVALKLAKEGGRLIYYRHLLGVDEAEAAMALRKELRELLPAGSKSKVRRVRDIGPRWIEMVAEVRLPT